MATVSAPRCHDSIPTPAPPGPAEARDPARAPSEEHHWHVRQTGDFGDDPGRRLCCSACGQVITWQADRIRIEGEHRHTKVNPAGIVFHLGCFAQAPGCEPQGQPTRQHSWFAGFAWRLALCRGCRRHLGWLFETSSAAGFAGLILARLVPRS